MGRDRPKTADDYLSKAFRTFAEAGGCRGLWADRLEPLVLPAEYDGLWVDATRRPDSVLKYAEALLVPGRILEMGAHDDLEGHGRSCGRDGP